MVSEGTTKQRAKDTGKSIGCTEETGECRTTGWWCGEGDDGVCSGTETSCSQTGNGTTDDEGFSVGSCAADRRADFEDEKGGEEGPFEIKKFVCLAPCFSGC
jgi:hypothetical protein